MSVINLQIHLIRYTVPRFRCPLNNLPSGNASRPNRHNEEASTRLLAAPNTLRSYPLQSGKTGAPIIKGTLVILRMLVNDRSTGTNGRSLTWIQDTVDGTDAVTATRSREVIEKRISPECKTVTIAADQGRVGDST